MALLLSAQDVRAQTLSADGSLSWGIKGGPSTSQVVNGALVIGTALALTVAAPAILGGASATMALGGRTLTVAASAVGPIAAAMLRQAAAKGPLTGAMLALAVAMASDTVYNPAANTFTTTPSGDPKTGTGTVCQYSSGVVAGTCRNNVSYQQWVLAYRPTATNFQPLDCRGDGGKCLLAVHLTYWWNNNWYDDLMAMTAPNSGTPAPSTDVQLSTALQAPAALAKVWDAGGCPQKITSYRDTVSADDPCAQIVGPQGGKGAWTPVTVPNGGVITLPTQTATSSTVGADGKTTTTTTATTPKATVTPNTDAPTVAANPVLVQTGATVARTVNDGTNATTTTTTTTNPPGTENPPQDGSATFSAGDAKLYDKKSKTFTDVLTAFQAAINSAPWMQAAKGFFAVNIVGGSCPHWAVPASKWLPALDATPFVCSSVMLGLYQVGGVVVLAVAAWAAFRIAFL